MKYELLTNVSHDIKTPLISIITYLYLLHGEPIESMQAQEYIEVLERQAARLKKLITDLIAVNLNWMWTAIYSRLFWSLMKYQGNKNTE